jgi:hypothetical protein
VNIAYAIAIVVLLLGLGLLAIWASATNGQLTLLGITFHAHLARGMGIISVIFSIVTFLVAYGSSLPPRPTNRGHS